MRFVPFPPTLVRLSADVAREHAASGRPTSPYVTAAYRTAEGKLRLAYDPYAPEMPLDSVPGTATVHRELRHYANETSGHVTSLSGFRSAADMEADGVDIDWTAAGMVLDHRLALPVLEPRLVVAENEEEMAAFEAGLDVRQRLVRAPVKSVGAGRSPSVFCAVGAVGRPEIHAADTRGELAEAMLERYPFLAKSVYSPLEALADHGIENRWAVSVATRADATVSATPIPTA